MFPDTTYVGWEERGAVGILTLRRPERANAYHRPLLEELAGVLAHVQAHPEVRVLVLTGEGRHFCAGADLKELEARRVEDVLSLYSQRVFNELAQLPRLTIAAIRGAALAGGLELALACDLRIAASDARFGLPETRLGLIPAAGGTQRLPALIGMARAKEIILAGRELSAEEAQSWGLVSRVVPSHLDVLESACAWAKELAERDPLALQLAKQALDLPGITPQDLRLETLSQAVLVARRQGAG